MGFKLFLTATFALIALVGLSSLLPPHQTYAASLNSPTTHIDEVARLTTAVITPTIITATGTVDVTNAISDFRTLLGSPDNGDATGSQAGGRREISWDNVPANLTNVDSYPEDFFNTNSPRGVILTFPAGGFRVSDNDFSDVNPTYDAEFNAFSSPKTAAPAGGNVYTATFRIPGEDKAARVNGFGLIFADVDLPGSSSLELFNGSQSLGVFFAPTRSDSDGLSFLGVKFNGQVVTHASITTGQGALGAGIEDVSNGGTLDLVVLDNILYSEPQAQTLYLPSIIK